MMEEQNVGRAGAGAGTGRVPGPLRNCSQAVLGLGRIHHSTPEIQINILQLRMTQLLPHITIRVEHCSDLLCHKEPAQEELGEFLAFRWFIVA